MIFPCGSQTHSSKNHSNFQCMNSMDFSRVLGVLTPHSEAIK
jgi:hypothetical protein